MPAQAAGALHRNKGFSRAGNPRYNPYAAAGTYRAHARKQKQDQQNGNAACLVGLALLGLGTAAYGASGA